MAPQRLSGVGFLVSVGKVVRVCFSFLAIYVRSAPFLLPYLLYVFDHDI